MNKQQKNPQSRGIEWTDYTWNPVGGCKHGCRWTMPDGSTAICYAEEVANGVARHAYPQGFDSHYWHPAKLDEPLKLKTPSRIFLDSMADLMGAWVPENQIQEVLNICEVAPWHTFQLLTKNAPRLLKFKFPKNVWVGASVPPTHILGKPLSQDQQVAMLRKSLASLYHLRKQGNHEGVRWMSFEPLSWDVASVVEDSKGALEWAVIGAATNGKKTFQPEKAWVENLLNVLDKQGVKVFFKGNLEWPEWREEFPVIEAPKPEPEIKQLTLEVTAPVNAPVAPPEPFSEAFRQDYAQIPIEVQKAFRLQDLKNSQADDTWYTPAPYVEAARLVMGSIELDPASDELGNETVKADRYFTKEDDGLSQEWNARTGFMNAPGKQKGSGQAEWLAKAEEEYEAGRLKELIGCIFNASGIETRWFQKILGKYPLCLVGHRMRFIPRPGRYEPGTNNQPVHGNAFVYMGPNPERFTEVFSQFGKVIPAWEVAPKVEAVNTDYAQLSALGKLLPKFAYLANDKTSKYHGVKSTTELIERLIEANAAATREIVRLTQADEAMRIMAMGLHQAVNELSSMDYQIVISVKCADAPLGIVQAHGTAVWDVLDRAVQQVKAYKVGTHRKAEDAA